MAPVGAHPLVGIVCLLLLSSFAAAEIRKSQIALDTRSIILFSTFGFNDYGHIDIVISNFDFHTSHSRPKTDVDFSRLGFFITTAEAETELSNELLVGNCVLSLKYPSLVTLFTMEDFHADYKKNHPKEDVLLKEYTYRYNYTVPHALEYSLFFANCQDVGVPSFDIEVKLYNVDRNGEHPDFLSAGMTELPKLYLVFFLAYVAAGATWLYACYKQRATVHRIHLLMSLLVFLKALTVFSQAGEYTYIKSTGAPHGWNIAFYIFGFFRGIMLFTIIVLIGTGWSFLKPFLQDKERKVLMIVIPLQVFANIAIVVVDETGPSSREWFTWRNIFHLLDIICCCAILFPIVWSIRQLREASHSDGKAARNYMKLMLFRQFYIVVVCYIYFTRIIVYLLQSTTPYHYSWTADLASEAATLFFYCFVGYKFRPVEQNPYFVLDEEEEAAAEQALKDEDFDL